MTPQRGRRQTVRKRGIREAPCTGQRSLLMSIAGLWKILAPVCVRWGGDSSGFFVSSLWVEFPGWVSKAFPSSVSGPLSLLTGPETPADPGPPTQPSQAAHLRGQQELGGGLEEKPVEPSRVPVATSPPRGSSSCSYLEKTGRRGWRD